MQAIDVVRAYFAAWNRRDPAGIVALFAESSTYRDPSLSRPMNGSAIGIYAGVLFAAFPDLNFESLRVVDNSVGMVAIQWLMRGAHHGPLHGLPPTGRKICLSGVSFIQVRRNQIHSVDVYFDQKALAEQLGLRVPV